MLAQDRVVDYNVEVRWVRRRLCLPLLESQNSRDVLRRNKFTQRVIYSTEASNCGLIGKWMWYCFVISGVLSLFTCGVVARLLLLTQQSCEALSPRFHLPNCARIFNLSLAMRRYSQ